jgi:ADP-heptose:LPS heptosyltransferase
MLPEDWRNIGKVLVMQLGSYQDIMQTIPVLQKWRQLLPDATLTLMVSQNDRQIGLHLPWVDEILVGEGAGTTFVDAERELTLISQLRQRVFDAAVICTHPGESPYPLAYICYLAGIPIRIGQSQEFGGGVLSQWEKLPLTQTQAIHSLDAP